MQYWIFISNAVQGDLRQSITDKGDVGRLIAQRFPNSLSVGAMALALSTMLGIMLGVAAAVNRNTWIDKSVRVVAVLGQSVPSFWLSIMLIFVFSVVLRLLPTWAQVRLLTTCCPVAVLTFLALPLRTRLMRSSMLEILGAEYVKLTRATGLSEQAVVWQHAVRNALFPQLTSFGLTLAFANHRVSGDRDPCSPGQGSASSRTRRC